MNNVVRQVRQHPRIPVEIAGECLILAGATEGVAMSEVMIGNLSVGGCRLHADPGYFADGCEVAIRFGDVATVRGMVCWSTQNDVGVRFFERLMPALVEQLADPLRAKRHLRSVA